MPILLVSLLVFSLNSLQAYSRDDNLIALCYGPGLYGNKTANGQVLTRQTPGVAHRRWPLGTILNLKANGRIVKVRVIDRGPYSKIGSLDITEAAVKSLGFSNCSHFGVRKVAVEKCQ